MGSEVIQNEQALPMVTLEGFDDLPSVELRQRADGAVEFRYCAGGDSDSGGSWLVMSETARRNHISVGGKIGEWLKSLE